MSGARKVTTVLPGFEHVARFWDTRLNDYLVKVKPGEYFVSQADEPISTTLGSCIAVCVRDPQAGIGGMNHFMLPAALGQSEDGGWNSGSARYGNFAMEHLINTLFTRGARRQRLEFKIFGGGAVLASDSRI
ncbi:unnamed protein product, partial [Cyprideis torosa]